jgi:hypothetical protein
MAFQIRKGKHKIIMKELLIIISSTWKFAATFPVAVFAFKMSFMETLLYTNIGGIIGIVVFSLASKGIIHIFDFLFPKAFRKGRKPKKIFTKRNRRIIKIKLRFGLPGIILLTHVLLSIPVGVFLLTKYYGSKIRSYFYLVAGQLAWSVIFTFFFTKVYTLIPL